MATPLSIAVVTGGHSYDVINFRKLFDRLEGIEAYVQPMDDFAASSEVVRDRYDAVVFYIMLQEGPADEGLPWYCGKPRKALERLGTTTQGIVILHHALLAYPEWPRWRAMAGIDPKSFEDFHQNEDVLIDIAAPEHPIVAGLKAWSMTDETYTMANANPDCDVLLTTDHEKSMQTLAWTRQHENARVFCLQSGHDNPCWVTPQFQTVLRRGIQWSCGRTPQ